MRFRFGKKKPKPLDENLVVGLVQSELEEYTKRDDVKKILKEIEEDERKKKVWESLSPLKKLKVLRYAARKKGGNRAKK